MSGASKNVQHTEHIGKYAAAVESKLAEITNTQVEKLLSGI